MRVEYRLNSEDYLSLYAHIRRKNRHYPIVGRAKRFVWAVCLLVILLLALELQIAIPYAALFYLQRSIPVSALEVAVFVIAGLLIIVLVPCLVYPLFTDRQRLTDAMIELHARRDFRRELRNGQINLSYTIRAEIDAFGLTETCTLVEDIEGTEKTTEVRSRGAWTVISTIDLEEEYALFQVGKAGWLILPRRAFNNDKEFMRFVTTAFFLKAGPGTAEARQTRIMELAPPTCADTDKIRLP
jgi:hypothetical protein